MRRLVGRNAADGARLGAALLAVLAALWAGFLALGEEAAVGEAPHTLGDAPPVAAGARVPLHRAFHVSRLALLVLGAVAAADAVRWWERPWVDRARGGRHRRACCSSCWETRCRAASPGSRPELAALAFPLGRRTLPPFAPLLRLLAGVDRGLHTLVGATGPATPALGSRRARRAARRLLPRRHHGRRGHDAPTRHDRRGRGGRRSTRCSSGSARASIRGFRCSTGRRTIWWACSTPRISSRWRWGCPAANASRAGRTSSARRRSFPKRRRSTRSCAISSAARRISRSWWTSSAARPG